MSWSQRLIDALSANILTPLYILRVTQVNDSPGVVGYVASSIPGFGDPIIGEDGVRMQGSTLTPGTWATTIGGFSVDLAGNLRTLKQSIVRGTFIEVYIGFPGWRDTEYEVIAIGQVSQLSGRSPNHATLDCRDLIAALRSRPTRSVGMVSLGFRLSGGTTITSTYHTGDTTVSLTSVSDFAYATGGQGACLISPTGDDPFILTFTGISGLDLTGVSSTAQHGTTGVNANSGDTIQPVYWLNSHPIDAARYVLISRGDTTTSAYDTLTAGDGLGLPHDWIDHDDCASHRYASNTVSGLQFEVTSQDPIDDILSWLQGWLACGGFYVTTRMGLLTIRSAQCSTTFGSAGTLRTITLADQASITDADIESIAWEAWDPDADTEASDVAVISAGGQDTAGLESPSTLPAVNQAQYDASDLIFSDESAARASILARIWEAHQRIPERYTLVLRGLSLARLASGDYVRISTTLVAGRLSNTINGLDNVKAIVTQVSPDFGAIRVRLAVVVYPLDDGVYP